MSVNVVAAEVTHARTGSHPGLGLADRRWLGADVEQIVGGKSRDDGDEGHLFGVSWDNSQPCRRQQRSGYQLKQRGLERDSAPHHWPCADTRYLAAGLAACRGGFIRDD